MSAVDRVRIEGFSDNGQETITIRGVGEGEEFVATGNILKLWWFVEAQRFQGYP